MCDQWLIVSVVWRGSSSDTCSPHMQLVCPPVSSLGTFLSVSWSGNYRNMLIDIWFQSLSNTALKSAVYVNSPNTLWQINKFLKTCQLTSTATSRLTFVLYHYIIFIEVVVALLLHDSPFCFSRTESSFLKRLLIMSTFGEINPLQFNFLGLLFKAIHLHKDCLHCWISQVSQVYVAVTCPSLDDQSEPHFPFW